MNRGSRDFQTLRATPVYRFNEAPIHESGKCRFNSLSAYQVKCFNEAPIHESGK